MRNDDHLERKDLRIGLGMFHVGADMLRSTLALRHVIDTCSIEGAEAQSCLETLVISRPSS